MVVKIQGIKCRALLDTGASNSYMSSTLVDMINKEPMRQESKTIEMTFQSTTRTIKVYDVELTGLNSDLKAKVEMNRVERGVLLHTKPTLQQGDCCKPTSTGNENR